MTIVKGIIAALVGRVMFALLVIPCVALILAVPVVAAVLAVLVVGAIGVLAGLLLLVGLPVAILCLIDLEGVERWTRKRLDQQETVEVQ